jgi:hypothetical protein
MALEIAASGPGGRFLQLINSGNINNYKFNQKPGRTMFLPSVKPKFRIV